MVAPATDVLECAKNYTHKVMNHDPVKLLYYCGVKYTGLLLYPFVAPRTSFTSTALVTATQASTAPLSTDPAAPSLLSLSELLRLRSPSLQRTGLLTLSVW